MRLFACVCVAVLTCTKQQIKRQLARSVVLFFCNPAVSRSKISLCLLIEIRNNMCKFTINKNKVTVSKYAQMCVMQVCQLTELCFVCYLRSNLFWPFVPAVLSLDDG